MIKLANGAKVLAADIVVDFADPTVVRGVVVAKLHGSPEPYVTWRVYAPNVDNTVFVAESGTYHARQLDAFATYDRRRGVQARVDG